MSNIILFLQAKSGDPQVNYNAVDVRRFIASTYPIEGVLGNGQLKVTQRGAGANMSVDVAAGGCVVQCDYVTNGGSYLLYETTTVNVTVPSPPSSGSRTHLIVEQVVDPQSDGSTGGYNLSGPQLVEDTGSGATLPKSAYLLAQVSVTAGQASVTNANITDMRNQASGPPPETKGKFSGTLSGAGRLYIPHNMDTTPSDAQITQWAGNAYIPQLVDILSTQIVVQFVGQNGQLGASGQPVTCSWVAYR